MYYITVRQSPIYQQMTLEDFLFNTDSHSKIINSNTSNTKTYEVEKISERFMKHIDVVNLIEILMRFNESNEVIHNKNRESLYTTFYTEKKGKGMPYVFRKIFKLQKSYVQCDSSEVCREIGTKIRQMLNPHSTDKVEQITKDTIDYCVEYLTSQGLTITHEQLLSIVKDAYRRIDAPKDELKDVLYQLKHIFEGSFGALYHTSAFAYVRHRSTLDAMKRHQANESKWFGKYDLSNFFGNTTTEFVMNMFSMIFPFSEVIKIDEGRQALEKAISLCMLNGGLPQGTPISPLITNIMMIPVDYKLANTLRDYNNQRYTYTRYADDFTISSKYNFDFKAIEKVIVDTLASFNSPFTLKAEKTRYGSSAGSNWNLGVMLNKDNKITVGHEAKRKFQAMLHSYVKDKQNGHPWDLSDVRTLDGYRNYYKMVEGDNIDKIVEFIGNKLGINIVELIKADLKP